MAKHLEVVEYVSVPCGTMRCVACSDFKQQPGQMWLGYTKAGTDMLIACPACRGTGVVTRYKMLDARTGQEIDYEKPGQTFVQLGVLDKAEVAQPRDKLIVLT